MSAVRLATAVIYAGAALGFVWVTHCRLFDLATLCWIAHFLRRVVEALGVHNYSRRGLSSSDRDEFVVGTFLGALVYYVGFDPISLAFVAFS